MTAPRYTREDAGIAIRRGSVKDAFCLPEARDWAHCECCHKVRLVTLGNEVYRVDADDSGETVGAACSRECAEHVADRYLAAIQAAADALWADTPGDGECGTCGTGHSGCPECAS